MSLSWNCARAATSNCRVRNLQDGVVVGLSVRGVGVGICVGIKHTIVTKKWRKKETKKKNGKHTHHVPSPNKQTNKQTCKRKTRSLICIAAHRVKEQPIFKSSSWRASTALAFAASGLPGW